RVFFNKLSARNAIARVFQMVPKSELLPFISRLPRPVSRTITMVQTAPTLKQKAHELIDRLPDTATWDDVAEALSVVEDIEAGLSESDAGLGVDTTTLRKRYGLPE